MSSIRLQTGLAVSIGVALSISLMACGGGSGGSPNSQAVTTSPVTYSYTGPLYYIFGVDNTNTLFEIDTTLTIQGTTQAVTGMQPGENVVGMAFSAEANLILLGSTSRIYQVDPNSGIVTEIGTGPFSPALSGSHFGFSINPVSDEIRVTSDTGQNITVNLTTGLVDSVDPVLTYAAGDPNVGNTPDVVVTTSSCNCEAPPTIYGLDLKDGNLISLGSITGLPVSADSSSLFTIGSLGIGKNLTGTATLALPDKNTFAFATLGPSGGGTSSLYTVQLGSGAAALMGSLTSVDTVVSLAVLPTSN